MIHVVTVHWTDDRWIDIQLSYLSRHLNQEYKTYAFLNGIDESYGKRFDYCSTEPIESHPVKLNLLADIASFNASSEEDWLIFLDGDAFPIGDLVAYGKEKLSKYPLVAVQRLENNGDIQPHPCFCLTTIGFWKSINGDWKSGYKWRNNQNEMITDVGGNLLNILNSNEADWYPMTRSNRNDLHPLFFGIYDNLIYHHGSGFRSGASRIFILQKMYEIEKNGGWFSSMRYIPRLGYAGKVRDFLLEKRAMPIARNESNRLNTEVFNMLENNPEFYKVFL